MTSEYTSQIQIVCDPALLCGTRMGKRLGEANHHQRVKLGKRDLQVIIPIPAHDRSFILTVDRQLCQKHLTGMLGDLFPAMLFLLTQITM